MKMRLLEDIDSSTDSELIPWTPGAGFDVGKLDLNKILEISARRDMAGSQVTPCPRCKTKQVQLVDWSTDKLQMKCRHCKLKYSKQLDWTIKPITREERLRKI